MSTLRLRQAFKNGSVDKPTYIRTMLERHKILFEYSEYIRDTDIEAIEIRVTGPVFRLRNMPFVLACPPNEARVAPIEILNFGGYEAAEISAIAPLIKNSRTILDVGANIGWFSLWFAYQQLGAHVHSFEPVPTNFGYLSRNVVSNNMCARITCYNYGFSDKGGVFDFFTYPTGATNASLLNVSGAEDARRVVGLTITMDDWVENFEVCPDFIKCDVEGAELLVFTGGRETLQSHRPIVFMEMLRKWSQPFGYHPNDVIRFFDSLEYSCFAIGAGLIRPFSSMNEKTAETSFIFLHREKHAESITDLRG